MHKNFLFVCGTARSGTTMLAHLLSQHPSVAIGIERYKKLPARELVPDVFTKERFFDFRPGDTTGYNPKYYARLAKKFDTASWVGDKVPGYYTRYDDIFRNFPGCKVGYILRHIHPVASSWNVRADKSTGRWSAAKDYHQAVEGWNTSIALTLRFLERYPEQLFVIEYEKLASGDEHLLRSLFAELGLTVPEQTYISFRKTTADWPSRAAKELVKKQGQDDYIAAHADWSGYQAILERALPRRCTR